MSAPTNIFAAKSTKLPPLTQVLTPSIEKFIIHNIELNSDQEDGKPNEKLVQKKIEKKKRKKFVHLGK